jgi:hypothetical protein
MNDLHTKEADLTKGKTDTSPRWGGLAAGRPSCCGSAERTRHASCHRPGQVEPAG